MLACDSALLVGDVHGFIPDLEFVLGAARDRGHPVVIQLGDLGFDPLHNPALVHAAATARDRYGVDLWFLDGNHEHHELLRVRAGVGRPLDDSARPPVELTPGFVYLTRGSRLEIAGRSALALGGAISLDRRSRAPGVTWFPEEAQSADDLAAAITGGPAEILLAHDAPAGWVVPGTESPPRRPFWREELPVAERHRHRFALVLEVARPALVVHGHYHRAYDLEVTTAHGSLRAVGLDRTRLQYCTASLVDRDGALDLVRHPTVRDGLASS